jgi:hypothetical protein
MVRHQGVPGRLAALEAVLLTVMVLLSGSSRPPQVPIDDLPMLEAGTRVAVVGLLAENWLYESGSEGLLLADSSSANMLRVVCTRAAKLMPSQYAAIGDEIRVQGELAGNSEGLYLLATSDGVERLRSSACALTVRILCENWMAFLNDRVSIRGILLIDESSGEWRLADASSDRSMALDLQSTPPAPSGCMVEAEGTMVLDGHRMEFVFVACSVLALP